MRLLLSRLFGQQRPRVRSSKPVTRMGSYFRPRLEGLEDRAVPAVCQVLDLNLQPINLDLLGLEVHLGGGQNADKPISLEITGDSRGGLLGQLVCGLTGPGGLIGSGNAIPGALLDPIQDLAESLAGSLPSGQPGGRTAEVPRLELGPVDLNLLGLGVELGGGRNGEQPIVLEIDANPNGGILGQLFAGLANGNPSQLTSAQTTALNGLLSAARGLTNSLTDPVFAQVSQVLTELGGSGPAAAVSQQLVGAHPGVAEVLRLEIGPVDLNLLGLNVELGGGRNGERPIVLDVTADPNGGLLGQVLAGLADGNFAPLTGLVDQVRSVLTTRLDQLLAPLDNLLDNLDLNGPTATHHGKGKTCEILDLDLGPIDLNLLGLRVQLGGGEHANLPISLEVTAMPSGGILGQLLCGLAGD
jgi:hypothetical protein